MPIVALSLMLHALHVLKHAPLVSALASTLFSGQLYSPNHQNNHHHIAIRHSPSSFIFGGQSVSPESSRSASPVTSKFHSFGLLGSSPASFDPFLPAPSPSLPHARVLPQRSATPPTLLSPSHSSQNPYRLAIYEYLCHVHSDRLVLPVLMLIYLAGRNSGSYRFFIMRIGRPPIKASICSCTHETIV